MSWMPSPTRVSGTFLSHTSGSGVSSTARPGVSPQICPGRPQIGHRPVEDWPDQSAAQDPRALSNAAATSSSRRSGAVRRRRSGRRPAARRRSSRPGTEMAGQPVTRDEVRRAHPVEVRRHRPAVDLGRELLVGRERRHLRDRQHQHVVRRRRTARIRSDERGALGVGARDVGAGEALPGADVVGERLLERVGVGGQQLAERRLEVPGPQGAEGVVGLGEVGVRRRRRARRRGDTGAGLLDHARRPRRRPRTARRGRAEARPAGRPRAPVTRRRERPRRGRRAPCGDPGVRAGDAPTAAARGRRRCGPSARRPTWSPTGCRSATPGTRPERRPQPDDPAERRGVAQRAAHVGAVGERHHPGAPARRPRPRWTRRPSGVGSTGLRVVPKTGLNVWDPAANSGTLVLPIDTAPARRIRSTTRSSASGTWSANSGEPYVVRQPATSWVSLNANGSPCSGPPARRAPVLVGRRARPRGHAPRRARRSR